MRCTISNQSFSRFSEDIGCWTQQRLVWPKNPNYSFLMLHLASVFLYAFLTNHNCSSTLFHLAAIWSAIFTIISPIQLFPSAQHSKLNLLTTSRLRLFIHAINKIIYSQLCLSLSAPKALIYMFAIAPVKHCDPFYCENYMLLLLP